MNDNFQSYSNYAPAAEALSPSAPLQARSHDTVYRTSSVDGSMSESTASNDAGNAGQLNPHHGDGSILSTARNADGSPVTVILATTLIEVDGLQAPASFWVMEGRMEQAPDGTFRVATGKLQAAAETDQGDILPLNPVTMEAVNAALAPMADEHMDSLIGTAMGMAVGRLTPEALVQRFAQLSGLEISDSAARTQTMMTAYQAQADEALRSRSGIQAGDLPAFYEWARQNAQGALQEAVQKQMRLHDVSGYKDIATKWLSRQAPSIEAFKRAGIPTRAQGQGSEVYIRGQWMSPGAASKAGLV